MRIRKDYIILIFLSIIFSSSFSQPYEACFTAEKTRGCAPFTVNLIDCSGTSDISGLPAPFYQFTTGSSLTTDTFYTYTTPGIYSITQYVDNGLNGSDDTTITNYIEVLPSPEPVFSVGLCQNNQVVVRIEENIYEEYFIDYGFGPADTIPGYGTSTYIYPDTSPRTITVTGNYNPGNCGTASSQTVTPFTDLIEPDLLSLSPGSEGTLEIEFNALPHQLYIIEIDQGGGYLPADTLTGFSGGTVNTGISNESGNTCFRIRTKDACDNMLLSEEICSISLSVAPENQRNILSWNSDPARFSSFHIYRDDVLLSTTSTLNYMDSDVLCGTTYCYTIRGILPTTTAAGQEITASSSEKCATAISTTVPPAPKITAVTFSGGMVLLSWEAPPGSVEEFLINTTGNGSGPATIGRTNNLYFEIADAPKGSCYTVSYSDVCGNQSPATMPLCPVFLDVSASDSYHELSWTQFSGHFKPTSYVVEVFRNGALEESFDAGLNTSYSVPVNQEDSRVVYSIRVTGSGNENSFSNPVEVKNEISIYAPNIFTPNFDGHNDVFLPKGKFIETYRLIIVNRWGEHVFSTTDPSKGWNGLIEGRPAPEGAYGYVVEAADKNGKSKSISGTVTLVR